MPNSKAPDGTGFKQDVHRMGQGVGAIKADVSSLAHGAVDAARSGVSELRHGAQHAVEAATDTAHDMYVGARKAAACSADSVKELIVRNPVASVGIAAGVGLVIGMVMRRARSQK